MKKRLLALLIVAVLVFGLVACANNNDAPSPEPTPAETPADTTPAEPTEPSDDPVVRLVYAEVNPLDTTVGQVATTFRDKVYELSGGTVVIDVQASGVLGSEEHVLDDMIGGLGTIQMARISAFALNPRGAEMSRLLGIPFAFESREHFWNFATSDLADEFLQESLDLGLNIRGLFYGEEGFRHFFTRDAIAGIEDLAGMQLRVSTDPVMVGLVEGIGANAVVVPFTELYSALQTGVVDGAEQPITNYEANAFPEVAPYLILNGHTLGVIQIIILEDVWQNELTENQRNAITEAIAYVQAFNQRLAEEADQASLERMRAAGVTIVDVPDLAPWVEAVSDVVAENAAALPELFEQIRNMR